MNRQMEEDKSQVNENETANKSRVMRSQREKCHGHLPKEDEQDSGEVERRKGS